jgi:hypothetical protein
LIVPKLTDASKICQDVPLRVITSLEYGTTLLKAGNSKKGQTTTTAELRLSPKFTHSFLLKPKESIGVPLKAPADQQSDETCRFVFSDTLTPVSRSVAAQEGQFFAPEMGEALFPFLEKEVSSTQIRLATRCLYEDQITAAESRCSRSFARCSAGDASQQQQQQQQQQKKTPTKTDCRAELNKKGCLVFTQDFFEQPSK